MDFRVAQSNWQNRIEIPQNRSRILCRVSYFNNVLSKPNQLLRSLDYVHTRTSSLHQSISAYTQMKLCRWGEETTPWALHARKVVFPLAPVDLVHQQRHVADGGCPCLRQVQVVCAFLCVWRMLQSRRRSEWQGSRRHHHYPISSARGEARGVCPSMIAGHRCSTTSTPMIRVACSADRCA